MELNKNTVFEKTNFLYDVIVVGGGPGGLSTGVYAQRFLLNSLIVEKGKGRSVWIHNLTNYLGLPANTPGHTLLKQGKEHYLSLNGDYLNAFVEDITDKGDFFEVKVKYGRNNSQYLIFKSKYLVAASGIIDYLPELNNMRNVYDYAGYNLHVCMVCDGYEMKDKKSALIVNSEERINTAFVLNWFTKNIIVFTNGSFEVTDEMRDKLKQNNFSLYESPIKQFIGQNHQMTAIELDDGQIIEVETGLISMGSKYHNNYLKNFSLNWKGENLIVDENCRTSHSRIFGIGDLKVGLNQVAVAVGDGAKAATAIWRNIRTKKN